MKVAAALLASVVAYGCAKEPPPRTPVAGWAARVKRADPAPTECVETSKRADKPRLAEKDYSDDESARAYKALDQFTDKELARADRCRSWARGQRK